MQLRWSKSRSRYSCSPLANSPHYTDRVAHKSKRQMSPLLVSHVSDTGFDTADLAAAAVCVTR